MAKHTPGPWYMTEQHERGPHGLERMFHIHGGPEDTYVAEVDCYEDRRDVGLREANARLIAAAPELAEALRRIAAVPSDLTSDELVQGRALAYERIARAALAKLED